MLSNYILSNTNVNTNVLPWDLTSPIPTDPHIMGMILAFNPARLAVLNAIIILSKRFRLVYATQARIAEMADVHFKTVQKEVKILASLGLIAKKYNGANKTCWYKSSKYFDDLSVMESLKGKLYIFYFTLRMLISDPIEHTPRSIIDLRSKEINIKRNPPKKESMYPVKKQIPDKPQAGEQKYNKPFLPCSLNPFSHKSFDENMQRWNEYENSQEVRNYISHFGDKAITKQRNDFMEKLYNQHKGSFVVEAITPEINRESITINAEVIALPNPQETKKDSTNSNVDQIKEFLKDNSDYNPFEELEDFDSPLLL